MTVLRNDEERFDPQIRYYTEERETTTTIVSKGDPTLTQVGNPVEFTWTEGLPRVAYSAGKTLSLGDYQFARVGVTIEVEYGLNDNPDHAYDTVKYLAKEIVAQESASIKREERENGEFLPGDYGKYRITLDYGLTLKTGRFDSSKVDVILTRYSTHKDLQGVLANMRGILSKRVQEEAVQIKSS